MATLSGREIIEKLHERGIGVTWTDDGKLRLNDPEHRLTDGIRALVRTRKADIIRAGEEMIAEFAAMGTPGGINHGGTEDTEADGEIAQPGQSSGAGECCARGPSGVVVGSREITEKDVAELAAWILEQLAGRPHPVVVGPGQVVSDLGEFARASAWAVLMGGWMERRAAVERLEALGISAAAERS